MAFSFKGSISFGLVYIPVKLFSSVRRNEIGFNMLDKKTMSRVKYKKTCVECGDREVTQQDIVKGYEYEDGKYVVFDDKDFEKIKTKKDKNIVIESFVNLDEIDPVYYDKPYYVVPTGAESAYALLLCAMEKENKAGIAKTVLGTKETLIALRVKDGKMIVNTLYFHDEIQPYPAEVPSAPADPAQLDLATRIISGMSDTFRPEKYKDEYSARVKKAIEMKISGKEIIGSKEKENRKLTDLMDALKQTLAGTPKIKSPARKSNTMVNANVAASKRTAASNRTQKTKTAAKTSTAKKSARGTSAG